MDLHCALLSGTAAAQFSLQEYADVGVEGLCVFMKKEDEPVRAIKEYDCEAGQGGKVFDCTEMKMLENS
jgi:hypothetical protein